MQIRQDASGMIRMAEKDVPQDILNVRIKRLGFRTSYAGGDAAYHPWDALQAVLETPEVRSYMQDNRIGSPVQMVPGMRPVPSPSPPHLSGDLENVTVSESLDHILRTFPGLWTYQDCVRTDGKRMVLFGIQ